MSLASSPPPRRVSLTDKALGDNAAPDSASASTSPRPSATSPSSWLSRRRRSSRVPSDSKPSTSASIPVADTTTESPSSPMSSKTSGSRSSSVKNGLKNALGFGKATMSHDFRARQSSLSGDFDGLPVSHQPSGLGLTSGGMDSQPPNDANPEQHRTRPSLSSQNSANSSIHSDSLISSSGSSSHTQRLAMAAAASSQEDLLALEPEPMTETDAPRSTIQPSSDDHTLTTREILNGAGSSHFLHNRLPATNAPPIALLDSVGKGSAAMHSPTTATRKSGTSYLERMRSVGSGGTGSGSSERRRLGERSGSGESHHGARARAGLPIEFRVSREDPMLR